MGRNGIRKIRATDVVIHDEFLDAARTSLSDKICNESRCYMLLRPNFSENVPSKVNDINANGV